MARKSISEFRAKTLLSQALQQYYSGIHVSGEFLEPIHTKMPSTSTFVIKVDQGVKGRFKKGLVLLNQPVSNIPDAVKQLQSKGYSQFLIEPMTTHSKTEERYLAMERMRDGIILSYSPHGGIDVESHAESIRKFSLAKDSLQTIAKEITVNTTLLENLITAFEENYISFLEINPFVSVNDQFTILDAAIEVDSTAEFFVNERWTPSDFTESDTQKKSVEEKQVQELASKSQAAFSLEVLNKDGSIFMMLSGGGASIVLADEVYNQGYGKELANYGEYSGNPNAEETYLYAKSILSLVLQSKAPKKVIIIAGGVANFTDVRITFSGLIKALSEVKDELYSQHCKIFVRRGGPFQEEGLRQMQEFLQAASIAGHVAGPEMILTDIVGEAIKIL